MSTKKPSGAELIQAERQRQIEKEGWTESHDDTHTDGELARAAACYAIAKHSPALAYLGWPFKTTDGGGYLVPDNFKPDSFRPKGHIRDLVKAGALLAAEIDRLQRLEK